MDKIIDPRLNKRLVFTFAQIAVYLRPKCTESTAYVNELIYRAMRAWVLEMSLSIHPNMAVAIDQAGHFWTWFRRSSWLAESQASTPDDLQARFENRATQILRRR